MPAKISHTIEDGVEKKRCSRCREYKSLDNYIYKADRWDNLHNECDVCRCIRNKRRANPDYELRESDLQNYNKWYTRLENSLVYFF